MNQGNDCYNLAEDALAAYRDLSGSEQNNLVRAAKMLAGQGNFAAPDELISEAYVRIADGRRPWPMMEAFLPFFAGVMKSLLSDRMFLTDARKIAILKHKPSVVNDEDFHRVAANDDTDDFDRKVLLEEVVSELGALIAGDEELELLWIGIQDGLIGKNLQEAIGVDAKRLATLRTRLNRQIDKLAVRYQAKEGQS